jgi:general secretion pathway protein A
MYCDYFGFSEKPFTLTPNPEFVFLSSIHREAFARLLYGIDSHAGFIALTGEVGTGKTTLLRALLTQLDEDRYISALVFNPCVTGEQLLANICKEFCIETGEQSRYGYLDSLNRFLIDQNSVGRTVVLVIDEAQNLEPGVLEQLRMISNLETTRDKLIQIVLAGQPELNGILRRHDMRQLNQRITVRCSLTPLKLNEVALYINHRLKVSGCRIPDVFSSAATRKIYRFSQGIPRLINVACEQALVLAWTREIRHVSSETVAEVVAELMPDDKSVMGVERLWHMISSWLFAGK